MVNFKFFSFLIILFFAVCCVLTGVSAEETNATNFNYTGPADSPSPGYNGVNGTGQSDYAGPQTNNTKYNKTIPSDLYISIGSDGTIYGAKDNKVYAFYANGSVKWEYSLINESGSAAYYPTIGNNETIYVFTKGVLYAINYDGTEKWRFDIGVKPTGATKYPTSPVIGSDGTIYVNSYRSPTSTGNNFFAVTPDGELIFNITLPRSVTLPLIDPNGYVIFGSMFGSATAGGLYKINPLNSSYERILTDYRFFAITIGDDGIIYAIVDKGTNANTNSEKYVIAVNTDGTQKWISDNLSLYYYSQTFPSAPRTSPELSVSNNGLIYLSNIIIDANSGNILGSNNHNASVGDSAENIAIGADGIIYVAESSRVAAYRNGVLLWSYDVEGAYNPVIGADGTLYFTAGGQLYAIADDFVPPVVDVDGDSGTYFNNVTVKVSVDKGVIYYTIDGSDPRTSPTRILLTGSEIIVNESCVLRIVGYDADVVGDGQFSNVTVLNYVIRNNFVSGNPSVSSGSYYNDLKVSLPTEDSLKIYYKIDNGNYMVYNGPISIDKSSSLSYYYEDASGNTSSVKSFTYTINKNYVPGNPSVTPGAYNKNLKVSLPKQTGKTLYYKVGSGSYKVYTSPITVTKTSTISYYFKDTLGKNSKVKTVKYTIDKTSPKVLDKNTKSYKKVRAKKQTLKIRFSESIKINSKYLKKLVVKNSKGKKIAVKFAVKNNYLYMKVPKITKKTKYFLTIPKNIVSDKVGNLLKSKVTLRYVSV